MSNYRFDRSRARMEEAKRFIPGGVNSFARLGTRLPSLVIDRAEGPYLYDIDGNRLVDYFMALGPIILGHRPGEIVEAVTQQLQKGILYSAQGELEFEAARMICDMVPCAERVRFATSGTEAVQLALRAARAATGRDIVIKFEGHYHGWNDSVLWSVAPPSDDAGPEQGPIPIAGSLGQDALSGKNTEVHSWNRPEFLLARLKRGDVAAVIMEPVMGNCGAIAPQPGYLEAVREACTQSGTILIFDEVVTGFRLSAGGAQKRFGVTPDLATFAKAIANGFQVAAVAGRAEIMDAMGGKGVVHGGTYNAQPVAMAAAVATMKSLLAPDFYQNLEVKGSRLMAGIKSAFDAAGIPVWVNGFPQMFYVALGLEGQPINYRDYLARDQKRYVALVEALLHRGVRCPERGSWFLCAAHDDAAIDLTLDALQDALHDIR